MKFNEHKQNYKDITLACGVLFGQLSISANSFLGNSARSDVAIGEGHGARWPTSLQNGQTTQLAPASPALAIVSEAPATALATALTSELLAAAALVFVRFEDLHASMPPQCINL